VVSARNDQLKLHFILNGIFGPGAVNPEKSILPCRVGDAIGWVIDIDTQQLYPNDKGCKKLAAVFFSCDTSKAVSVKCLQRMGSLASRYSRAIIGSRPFVAPFYEAASSNRTLHVNRSVKIAIFIWRAIALTLLHYPQSLAIPLSFARSFTPSAKYFYTSDAGPRGLGVVVRCSNGRILGYVSYRLPFLALASDFQNLREFLGAILGLIIIHHFARGPTVAMWTNDNTSALSWVKNDLAKSKSAQASFLIFTWCKIKTQIILTDTKHIAGTEMGDVDSLSRFLPTYDLPPHLDLSRFVPLSALDNLFGLCSPELSNQSLLGPRESSLSNIVSLLDACLVEW
jgi:hypothetical protein